MLRRFIPQSVKRTTPYTLLSHIVRPHNSIYNADYYERDVEPAAAAAASIMAETIAKTIQPSTVIDVGCGTGALLEAFRLNGCEIVGLEYADAGLARCKRRGIPAKKFNIATDAITERFDLAVSFEVAEHLAPWISERFVDLLCGLSDNVVISAAIPGQGGADHVNERSMDYWKAKFASRGYTFQSRMTTELSDAWRHANVASFYWANLMAFSH